MFSAYKINFLSILIIPVIGVVYQQRDFIFEAIEVGAFYQYISIWLAYMVTMTSFTIGYQLVMIREQQFLKQMKFIVQDYKYVIFSLILSQYFILAITVLILAITSSILFNIPLLRLLIFSYGVVTIPLIPLSFAFLVFNVIPIHAENLQPIITVGTALMLFSMNYISPIQEISLINLIVNPMQYVLEAGKIWGAAFTQSNLLVNYPALIVATLWYFAIGFLSVKHTKIVPNYRI